MELKTKVHAEGGRQELSITREFDLPVDLLFSAYVEPQFIEQWMGTKVVKLDNNPHGGYVFETTDPKGNLHRFSGVIHNIVNNAKIVRTFEMESAGFDVQLEFLDFSPLPGERSALKMHVLYRSVEARDKVLKLPFTQGINFAHNRIEELFINKKK